MSLALVTGAPGWIGTGLVRALIHGLPEIPELAVPPERRVRCLVQPGAAIAPLAQLGAKIDLVEGDLRREEDVARFARDARGATVFHCAGLIHPALRARELFEVNVAGTSRLLDAAIEAGARRFIYLSSSAAIERPLLEYGRSKRRAEQIVERAASKIQTVILRAPWFYGPNQPARQTLFFRLIERGLAPLIGGGENLRAMVYTDNLLQALLLAEKVDRATGRKYWISDRRAYSMREIVAAIERELGRGGSIPLPGAVGGLAAGADRILQSLGLYNSKLHVLGEMNKTICGSIEEAERDLGYDPRIALDEGMRRSIRWMREHQSG